MGGAGETDCARRRPMQEMVVHVRVCKEEGTYQTNIHEGATRCYVENSGNLWVRREIDCRTVWGRIYAKGWWVEAIIEDVE
jgi:hypothetical protein